MLEDNILVIGAGSVGALIGASLVKGGRKVTFAGKPNSSYTRILQSQGLRLYYADGKKFCISPLHPQVKFVDTATDLIEKFDIIIVALKSNDLIKVISYIQAHSTPDTILIQAQNGIPYWWFDNDTYLTSLGKNLFDQISSRPYLNSVDQNGAISKTLGHHNLVGCVVKAPCQRNEDGSVEVKKMPQLIMGLTKSDCSSELKAKLQHLCDFFSRHDLTTTYTNKIRTAVCHKLAINLTTNVLSALTGKVIADLTANPHINSLIDTIIGEINYVFSHYGIESEDLPTKQKIYAYIQTPGSQRHLPSLAQDFSQQKPGEISLITAPVEMAQIAQLNVPTLYSLSELLQLGQTYNLKGSNRQSHIITLDPPSGFCMFSNDAYQSMVREELKISNLLNHLIQVNLSSLNFSCLINKRA